MSEFIQNFKGSKKGSKKRSKKGSKKKFKKGSNKKVNKPKKKLKKNLEYEIRIKNLSLKKIDKIKNNIIDLGGKLINKRRIMPLSVYYHPLDKKDSYIRIRDEGKQITMTIKYNINSLYPVEREVTINSFKEGHAILKFLGCKIKYNLEKIRETYILKGAKEIVFDSYPGLPTYMEIDCHTKEDLIRITKLLGFKMSDHDKRNAGNMYKEIYGINQKEEEKKGFTFKNAHKIFGPLIKKNKSKFFNILKEQKKLL